LELLIRHSPTLQAAAVAAAAAASRNGSPSSSGSYGEILVQMLGMI